MNPFAHFVGSVLGLNTRYLIHKLIRKPKTKKFLKGNPKDPLSVLDQHLANMFTGFIVLGIILVLAAKILG